MTLVLLCTGAGARLLHSAGAEATWPFESAIRRVWRGACSRLLAVVRAQETLSRLHSLEDEVEQLRLDARMLEDLAAENRELRESFGLPPTVMRHPLVCEPVTWGGALGWWQSVRVNRGSADGVRVGDAVVCADGLVGRISKTHSRVSDVILVTDANSRIACTLALPPGSPTVRGILQGNGWRSPSPPFFESKGQAGDSGLLGFLFVADAMRLDYIDRKALDAGIIPARARVVTSGLGGQIPGGIPVGWLVSATLAGDGLYGEGRVLPAVDFAGLKTMAILVGGRADE
ncbi:MAG: rod shape-determining protein MreC [Kiritimatiellae bacterium]|nr:rod shape-determining protein MreC [Kiritimatiellia bacterium]